LRCVLDSAEFLSDSAIRFGSFQVNTPCSRLRAWLSRVTLADHWYGAVSLEPLFAVFDSSRHSTDDGLHGFTCFSAKGEVQGNRALSKTAVFCFLSLQASRSEGSHAVKISRSHAFFMESKACFGWLSDFSKASFGLHPNAGWDIYPVRAVRRGSQRLAYKSFRTVQTDCTASLKRADGFKKPSGGSIEQASREVQSWLWLI
jgi:hypothetical protein